VIWQLKVFPLILLYSPLLHATKIRKRALSHGNGFKEMLTRLVCIKRWHFRLALYEDGRNMLTTSSFTWEKVVDPETTI